MQRKTPFVIGETYHVFNRGAHKREIFTNESDFKRFMLLLLVANSSERVHLANLLIKHKGNLDEIFVSEHPQKPLVAILAYSLMSNHYHIVLKELEEGGVSLFMKRLMTAYAMYFNAKYDHSGVIFQGRFKSSHIGNSPFERYIFSYVHLNPLSLIEKNWEERGVQDKKKALVFMRTYPFSSYQDYVGISRSEESIISKSDAPEFVETGDMDDISDLLLNIKDRPLFL